VVKANGYGHTLKGVFTGLSATDGFALLDIAHAGLLREFGWKGPILLLEGIFSLDDIDECLSLQLDVVIHSSCQLNWMEAWLENSSGPQQAAAFKRIKIWLKLNSGMNRLGLTPHEYVESFHRLHSAGFAVNHLTHFANADDVNVLPSVDKQVEIFNAVTQGLSGQKSLANSAAILWHRYTLEDWCRPGIMLYGASPTGRYKDIEHANLKPAMLLRSEVIGLQNLKAGDQVGYGGRFVAQRETKIAIVACGYADGYPRHAPDGTPVWVAVGDDLSLGKLCPLAGRVSMDMITIDVTDHPSVSVGSLVELWGSYLPVDDVAEASGTVGYELMCALAPRVPVNVVN
jgi:alanine racemase